MAQTEVLLGTAFVADKGEWQSGTSYEENDIVHTDGGIYLSLADDNISTPSTDNEQWRLWVDKTDISKATEDADTATKATLAAITASKEQTDLAKELNDHPLKQGDNGMWWQYNPATKEYEDTGIGAIGGVMYPSFDNHRNRLRLKDPQQYVSQRVDYHRNRLKINI